MYWLSSNIQGILINARDCLILIGQCIHFGIFQRNWIRIPSKTDRIRNPESSSERYLEVEKLMAVGNKLQVS